MYYVTYLWTALGLIGALFMCGRPLPFITVCALLLGVPNLLAVSAFFRWQAYVVTALTCLFGLTSILGTLLAFWGMYRLRKMSLAMIGALLLAYLIVCAVYLFQREIQGVTELMLTTGLLILPFAPFALAPLALHWNRHR